MELMMGVSTALLALATFIYVGLTFKILEANKAAVQEMRQQQENALRPYIVISLVLSPEDNVFRLRIRNTGTTSARNLRLAIDKSFYQFGQSGDGKYDLKCFPAFNEQIDSFAPGSEMVFDLAGRADILGTQNDPNVTPTEFTVTASYDYINKKATEENTISLMPYREVSLPRRPFPR